MSDIDLGSNLFDNKLNEIKSINHRIKYPPKVLFTFLPSSIFY